MYYIQKKNIKKSWTKYKGINFRDCIPIIGKWSVNPLWLSEAYIRQWTGLSLAQVMACHLFNPTNYLNKILLDKPMCLCTHKKIHWWCLHFFGHYIQGPIAWYAKVSCSVWTRGCLNIKMSSYQYSDPHVKNKTVSRPSYLKHGNPHPCKRRSLYWDGVRYTNLKTDLWYMCNSKM